MNIHKNMKDSESFSFSGVFADKLISEGYVLIKNMLPPQQIGKVRKELEPYFASTPNCEGLFYGYKTRRISSIFKKSKASHKLALNGIILEIIDRVLGPHCDRFQIHLTQGIRIFPGEKEQVPHRDDEFFPFEHDGKELMINAMWALSSFTAENGGTRIWPGTNNRPANRRPEYEKVLKVEMEPGDVLLYLGSTLHCGGKNSSKRPRTGLVISYSVGWLRQAENQYLAYPPKIARRFPPDLQKLIGYSVHRPNLGWYEGQDPEVALTNPHGNFGARDLLTPEQTEKLKIFYEKKAALKRTA